jgi:hypothetical protein
MVAHSITHQPDPNWPSYRSSSGHRNSLWKECGRPPPSGDRSRATRFRGGGLGRQPGGSNTTDLEKNDFGLLAAIGLILRGFSTASRQLAVDALDGVPGCDKLIYFLHCARFSGSSVGPDLAHQSHAG